MELILHIGMGKTGTSALQSFLDGEAKSIANSGYLFTGIFLQNLLKDNPLKKQADVNNPELLTKALELFEKEASRLPSKISKVVWSNESFSMGYNSDEIVDIFKKFIGESKVFKKCTVYLVLRRQDQWVESAYKQWALKHKTNKGRYIQTPEEYLKSISRLLDYFKIAQVWNFDELNVVAYDDVIDAGGIVEYFCDCWAIDYNDSFSIYRHMNESLGNDLSKLISLYNRGLDRPVFPEEFMSVIKDACLEEVSSTKSSFISDELRRDILTRFSESNGKLSHAFFDGSSLFSASSVKSVPVYSPDDEILITYLAMICKKQQDRIEVLNKRLHRIENILNIKGN